MTDLPRIVVEFYGVPRHRAGRAELALCAGTLAQMLDEVVRVCPRLADLRGLDGRPAAAYLVSLNGERFVSGGNEALREGDRVLVLSADAGG
jgi:molybdopterin converting factor small subunit